VGGTPLVIDHALGTKLFDVDGREYLDYVCSWGALILGHAHPDVVAAVTDQAAKGTSYGMTSPLEMELGEMIVKAVPSIEMVRFVSSGTEAAMSAVRLARAFAGRDMAAITDIRMDFFRRPARDSRLWGLRRAPGCPKRLLA
jgi:glutamate-1-semialdehyde 2,1-aminomutase